MQTKNIIDNITDDVFETDTNVEQREQSETVVAPPRSLTTLPVMGHGP